MGCCSNKSSTKAKEPTNVTENGMNNAFHPISPHELGNSDPSNARKHSNRPIRRPRDEEPNILFEDLKENGLDIQNLPEFSTSACSLAGA